MISRSPPSPPTPDDGRHGVSGRSVTFLLPRFKVGRYQDPNTATDSATLAVVIEVGSNSLTEEATSFPEPVERTERSCHEGTVQRSRSSHGNAGVLPDGRHRRHSALVLPVARQIRSAGERAT